MKNKASSVVDLFAGCGGLSLGLEQAGFEPAYVNELNEFALGTYLLNRKDAHPHLLQPEFNSADIKKLNTRRGLAALKANLDLSPLELGLIVGGPPCQGFSGIGHRRSYGVDKFELPSNHLYQDMVDVIRALKPRAFLFENVKGLLTARWTPGGPLVWDDVWKAFQRLRRDGYEIAYELVHAKDYRVPQNRPRVLLVGVHRDAPGFDRLVSGPDNRAVDRGFLPKKVEGAFPHPSDLLGDLADPDYELRGENDKYVFDPQNDLQRQLRTWPGEAVPRLGGGALTEQQYSKHNEKVRRRFQVLIDTQGRGPIPDDLKTKKFAQRWLPPKWRPEPSITATSLPDDYVHYSLPRTLTVREWARLQTFPDWYQFKGPRTTGGLRRAGNPRLGMFERELPRYTQIGNAVPVALAKEVGEHLARLVGVKQDVGGTQGRAVRGSSGTISSGTPRLGGKPRRRS